MLRSVFLLLSIVLMPNISLADNTYQSPEDFLVEAFSGDIPEPKVVWLTGKRKETVIALLGHRYHTLRVRYWKKNQRSVWILEETGKKQFITTGLIVNDGSLERIKILIFRESRGWEVRYPFFTNQFKGIRLDQIGDLNHRIDGISGATLSVRAMKKMAALALYLDAEVKRLENVPASP